jgi:hypothetical protein
MQLKSAYVRPQDRSRTTSTRDLPSALPPETNTTLYDYDAPTTTTSPPALITDFIRKKRGRKPKSKQPAAAELLGLGLPMGSLPERRLRRQPGAIYSTPSADDFKKGQVFRRCCAPRDHHACFDSVVLVGTALRAVQQRQLQCSQKGT